MVGAEFNGCTFWSGELGRYDLDRFAVILGRHNDPTLLRLTAQHEYLHHHLTESSTYGWILRQIKGEIDAQPNRERSKFLGRLANECRVVQEMVATYVSVTQLHREDQVSGLPSPYKAVYERALALAGPRASSALLRASLVVAVGRCAMMTDPAKDTAELDAAFRSGERLPPMMRPDERLAQIESALNRLPNDAIITALRSMGYQRRHPVLKSRDYEALLKAVGGNHQQANFLNSQLDSLMTGGLCELLDEIIPGMADLGSKYRSISVARRVIRLQQLPQDLAKGEELIEGLRRLAEQRVAYLETAPPQIAVARPSQRNSDPIEMAHRSQLETGAVYLYAQHRNDAQGYFVTNTELDTNTNGRPIIRCTKIGEREAQGFLTVRQHLSYLAIIELDDVRRLAKDRLPAALDNLLTLRCFIYVPDNPIDFVVEMLRSCHGARWTTYSVGYATGAVDPRRELQIVLYRLAPLPHTFFHLSNPALTDALLQLNDLVVANPQRMRFLPSHVQVGEVAKEFPAPDIAHLVDHPMFSFYIGGRRVQTL